MGQMGEERRREEGQVTEQDGPLRAPPVPPPHSPLPPMFCFSGGRRGWKDELVIGGPSSRHHCVMERKTMYTLSQSRLFRAGPNIMMQLKRCKRRGAPAFEWCQGTCPSK